MNGPGPATRTATSTPTTVTPIKTHVNRVLVLLACSVARVSSVMTLHKALPTSRKSDIVSPSYLPRVSAFPGTYNGFFAVSASAALRVVLPSSPGQSVSQLLRRRCSGTPSPASVRRAEATMRVRRAIERCHESAARLSIAKRWHVH